MVGARNCNIIIIVQNYYIKIVEVNCNPTNLYIDNLEKIFLFKFGTSKRHIFWGEGGSIDLFLKMFKYKHESSDTSFYKTLQPQTFCHKVLSFVPLIFFVILFMLFHAWECLRLRGSLGICQNIHSVFLSCT